MKREFDATFQLRYFLESFEQYVYRGKWDDWLAGLPKTHLISLYWLFLYLQSGSISAALFSGTITTEEAITIHFFEYDYQR